MTPAPSPTWVPVPEHASGTAMARLVAAARERTGRPMSGTPDLHAWSLTEPDAFWRLVWDRFDVIGESGDVAAAPSTMPEARFFPQGRLNLAENLLARWTDSDAAAIVSLLETADGPAVGATLTGRELRRRVGSFAQWLRSHGVQPGDRVGLVLPVSLDAAVATLGALAVGAVVSSASPELGAPLVLDRFGQLEPRVLVVTPSYRWAGRQIDRTDALVDVVAGLPSLTAVLVADDPGHASARLRDAAGGERVVVAFEETLTDGTEPTFTRLPFDHPAYVLFSSGTTGRPKCLVHRSGGVLLKHIVDVGLHADVGPGDRLLYYTTTSWMMWNWELSCLALGATLVVCDGSPTYPHSGALFDAARRVGATHLGVGARLLDLARQDGVDLAADGVESPLRVLLATGSPLSEETARWAAEQLGPGVMINPISGGTDLIGCLVGGDPTRPFRAGEMTGPALGMAVDVWTDAGVPAADGEPGELVCTQPFPSVPVAIWGDESGERLRAAYFDRWPGIWVQGDRAVRSADGGFAILGRSDATLNVGGVRIGTAEIYAAIARHPAVAEALAFSQDWDTDTRIVLLVVPSTDVELDDAAQASIRSAIRTACSPRHVPAAIVAVPDLPRTRTGKLSEVAVRDAVNGRPVAGIDALANPETLDVIVAAVPTRS